MAHETSTINGYADVNTFGSFPGYDERFLDLHPDDLGTNIVERMIVKVDSTLSRFHDSASYRGLSLTRFENRFLLLTQAGMPPISSAS